MTNHKRRRRRPAEPTLDLRRDERTVAGNQLVRYRCTACEWSTYWHTLNGDALAAMEMRQHIDTVHPRFAAAGRCAECGRMTGHFKAVTPGGVVWLCERDSPAMSDLAAVGA